MYKRQAYTPAKDGGTAGGDRFVCLLSAEGYRYQPGGEDSLYAGSGAGSVSYTHLLVPGNLRDFAGLEKDVVLVGVASRIEIWSKAKWDGITEDEDEAMEDIAERMADLGLGI